MMPIFLPFFRWAEASPLSVEIRASTWQFAVIEMVHLIGLTMLLGSLMVLDLRLWGMGMRRQPVADLARDLRAWLFSGMALVLGSGILLFFGEPMKLYGSTPFQVKMLLLFLALVFQFTLFRHVTSTRQDSGWLHKLAGVLSLVLWFGVGLAGRGIGFL